MMHGFGLFGPWGWVGMILNLVLFVAVVIGVIWLIVSVIRRSGPPVSSTAPQPPAPAASTPREIVQARYARGEINREEYLQLMTDLEK